VFLLVFWVLFLPYVGIECQPNVLKLKTVKKKALSYYFLYSYFVFLWLNLQHMWHPAPKISQRPSQLTLWASGLVKGTINKLKANYSALSVQSRLPTVRIPGENPC
jgi:hypothetical protein